jgi:hypothetical protein
MAIPTTTVRVAYDQPPFGSSRLVAVVSSTGFLVGDVVLVAGGGYCTVLAIDEVAFAPLNPPNLRLKNSTATNPPGPIPAGATIGPPSFVVDEFPPGAVVAGASVANVPQLNEVVGPTAATGSDAGKTERITSGVSVSESFPQDFPAVPNNGGQTQVVTADHGSVVQSFPQDFPGVPSPGGETQTVVSVSGRVVQSFPQDSRGVLSPGGETESVTTVSGRVVEHFPQSD